MGATGELELHNLRFVNGKATGKPWADGGAIFAYGKVEALQVTFSGKALTVCS